MAQLQITIDIDNAAFEDATEIGRVLAYVASHIFDGVYGKHHWTNVHDSNGNPVGKFKVDPDAEPSFS